MNTMRETVNEIINQQYDELFRSTFGHLPGQPHSQKYARPTAPVYNPEKLFVGKDANFIHVRKVVEAKWGKVGFSYNPSTGYVTK